ncbi:hypothetical protein [Bacteroides sp. 51]|uniref:hypothetical protein n=1 Tax=Bacteroides sp. 51 TaxID=2302938 RepID=UPI0013CFDAA8|nr:hypothetical protein [Bacteroides sp. 51]NDV81337.1 hypothetical protein [Bacteroides sp. 51]
MKVIVTSVFRDKFTKELYQVGQELSLEDESRVKDLVSRELVEVTEEKKVEEKNTLSLFDKEFEKKTVVDKLKAIGEKATMNMKEETLIANVAALDEEKTAKLKESLGVEA